MKAAALTGGRLFHFKGKTTMNEQATAEKIEQPKSMAAMKVNLLKPLEHIRNTWHAAPAVDDTPSDIEMREYWKHHGKMLRPGDQIELLWEDNSQWALVYVVSRDDYGASVCFIHSPVKLGGKVKPAAASPFFTKWGNPHTKWRVFRASDGEVVREGFESQDDAVRYIKSTLKAM